MRFILLILLLSIIANSEELSLLERFEDFFYKKDSKQKSRKYFDRYNGKIVKKIIFERRPVFDPNEYNYKILNAVFAALNKVHVNSRDELIMKNLFIMEGDSVNPVNLVQSEKKLRELDFINEIYIDLEIDSTDTNLVDLSVITRDKWSVHFKPITFGENLVSFNVSERNFLGYGNSLGTTIYLDRKLLPRIGYQSSLDLSNFNGSLVDLNLTITDNFQNRGYSLSAIRNYERINQRMGGGLFYENSGAYVSKDTLSFLYKHQEKVIWGGLANPYIMKNERSDFNSNYINLFFKSENFSIRPYTDKFTNRIYHNFNFYCLNYSTHDRDYYQMEMITSPDRVEDIISGKMFFFDIGFENGEHHNRPYIGGGFKRAFFWQNNYLFYSFGVGSFIRKNNFEQLKLRANFQGFSKLLNITEGYNLRIHNKFDLLSGFYMFDRQFLNIGENNGYRSIETSKDKGLTRAVVSIEPTLFTEWKFLGFNTTPYIFTDIGWLGNDLFFKNFGNPGFCSGFGFRFSNPKTVFGIFQLFFSYTSKSFGSDSRLIRTKNDPGLELPQFDPGYHDVYDF
ncbi:MAG: hypothetical protein JXR48_19180 [Candidatus Delongbacteria bacterium]|nr:hypothetical protein [Candidatus Delongbacteria bacterium]MBN2837085.1 hypothetical protein [Candidatus Delongbacteria bacterium]